MSVFRQLAWLILAITFMISVTFFGRLPVLRKTPVGTLYRLIWHHLPHALSTMDQKLTSGRLSRSSSWLYNRIMYERHPTIVIFFLAIMIVSESMFIPPAWPQISPPSKLAVSVVVFMPYFFLYLSCSADPGYITPENHARHMSLYPFDHANFHPGSECRTCRLPKPARSKHCDVCKRCVARADHHCVFINSCVGYGNHGWFLLLLASTSLLTTYGGLLGLSLLAARMRGINPGWSLWPPAGMDRNAYLVVWAWGLQGNVPLAAATLLALLTTPLVGGLLGYSLFLVYCGTTTNESMKWADYKEDIADGFAYRRPLAAARPRDPWYEPRCGRWPAEAEHIMLATHDGRPPAPDADLGGSGVWERVRSLKDVDNLYDRGFWHNLCDIFQEDYAFGNPGVDEPPSERRWQRKMAKTG